MSGTAEMLGDAVAGFLGRGFGQLKSGDKTAARDLGVTPRTIRNWRTRQCTPHGAQLIELMAKDRAFRTEIEGLLDQIQERQHAAAGTSQAITARHRALVAAIDAPIGDPVPADRRLVPSASNIIAWESSSLVVSAAYVGPERRKAPRRAA